jgi:O-antigen ligase
MNTVLRPERFASDSTIQGRLELWAAAGKMFSEHPLGVGVGRFKEQVEEYNTGEQQHAFNVPRRVTHNSYLLCVTELGTQGAMVFCALIGLAFHKLRRCALLAHRTEDPAETRLLTYGCLLSMIIYLVAAAFTDRLYTESFWWVLAFPVCLQRAIVREVMALEPTPALLDRAEDWHEQTLYVEPNTACTPCCALD